MGNKLYSANIFIKIKNAFKGIWKVLIDEHFLYIHWILIITGYVLGGIFYKKMLIIDWAIITLSYFFMLAFEIMNSAIENITDLFTLKYNFKVKKIKDIAAGASLIMSLGSIIVSFIIFIPKIIG